MTIVLENPEQGIQLPPEIPETAPCERCGLSLPVIPWLGLYFVFCSCGHNTTIRPKPADDKEGKEHNG